MTSYTCTAKSLQRTTTNPLQPTLGPLAPNPELPTLPNTPCLESLPRLTPEPPESGPDSNSGEPGDDHGGDSSDNVPGPPE